MKTIINLFGILILIISGILLSVSVASFFATPIIAIELSHLTMFLAIFLGLCIIGLLAVLMIDILLNEEF